MLLTNCQILPDSHSEIISDGYIQIEKDTIISMGTMANCPQNTAIKQPINLKGKLVIPGLINAHNHCAMTLYRGLADDLTLQDWLHNHIFPAEAASVSKEMVYWCTKLAAAEMLLSGTTCVADGYFFSGEAAQALADCNMRAVVAHGIVDFPAPSVPDPSKNIEALAAYLDIWQNKHPLIEPAIFAHAPYTCSPKTLVGAKELADNRGCRFFIHIAESQTEQENIIDPQGSTPIKHLEKLDLLDSNTVCVHAVWLDEEDTDIVASSGAQVVLCPQSNFKLASGVSPGKNFINKGILTGLGTDGCASNNSLDMFREMRTAALSQKVFNMDATAMNSRQVLKMATTDNAKLLGLENLGKVQTGAKADLAVINTDRIELTPFYNQDILVYGGNGACVDSVIVNGELVVSEKNILSFNLEETLHKVRDLADQI